MKRFIIPGAGVLKVTAGLLLVASAGVFIACTSSPKHDEGYTFNPASVDRNPAAVGDRRGSLAEYDAGPPKDSQWPDIFAETPNYRAYGKALYQAAAQKYQVQDNGQEKFRWVVGPMWYRGRLTPNSVKVFVIGQEGAQDENTSNRTFTGSTGTKMQKFINYFGIDRSYLFMNTFMYTITGQYGEKAEPTDSPAVRRSKEVFSKTLFWLAQNQNSVVVQHRQRGFDYMLSQNRNSLRLVIGVGAAGKDTLATWIRSHGGNCTAAQLGSTGCDASVLAPGVFAVGVMHPGAASARNGGANAAASLADQFARRAQLVAQRIQQNPGWLTPDQGMTTDFSRQFSYGDASIPFRDFAFGTNWRMGKDGTSTNRRGADGIQIFSDNGCYNNAARVNGRCMTDPAHPQVLNVRYDEPQDIQSDYRMEQGDVPYESPKSATGRRDYDEGPGSMAGVLMGLNNNAWPNFNTLGVTMHASFGYGPSYRGNLMDAKVLVLGDQESQDDMFSARAMTGTGGQRLQSYLKALNVGRSYAIIRTLPVDTMDLATDKVKAIALNADVVKARNAILTSILGQGKTKLIVTVGPVAADAIRQLQTTVPVVNLNSPNDNTHVAQWQGTLAQIGGMNVGISPNGSYTGALTAIPRGDLPAHTRWWMGTSGSRGSRAYVGQGNARQWNGDYYQFNAPTWVNTHNYPARATDLSTAEQASVQAFRNEDIMGSGAAAQSTDD